MTKNSETTPRPPKKAARAKPRLVSEASAPKVSAPKAQAERRGADVSKVEGKAEPAAVAASVRGDRAQAAEKWVNSLTTAKPPVRPRYPTRDAPPSARAAATEPSLQPEEPKGAPPKAAARSIPKLATRAEPAPSTRREPPAARRGEGQGATRTGTGADGESASDKYSGTRRAEKGEARLRARTAADSGEPAAGDRRSGATARATAAGATGIDRRSFGAGRQTALASGCGRRRGLCRRRRLRQRRRISGARRRSARQQRRPRDRAVGQGACGLYAAEGNGRDQGHFCR